MMNPEQTPMDDELAAMISHLTRDEVKELWHRTISWNLQIENFLAQTAPHEKSWSLPYERQIRP